MMPGPLKNRTPDPLLEAARRSKAPHVAVHIDSFPRSIWHSGRESTPFSDCRGPMARVSGWTVEEPDSSATYRCVACNATAIVGINERSRALFVRQTP
jgi:hypothetical protein